MRHITSQLDACFSALCDPTRRAVIEQLAPCHIDASPLLEVQGWLEWQRILWEQQRDKIDQMSLSLDTSAD